MESFSLSFQTEEITNGLNDKFIQSKDRKAWMNNHPEIILEIDSQLRKYFEIGKEKLIFSLYESKNNLKIHDQKENVSIRIIVSTEDNILNIKNKKHKIKQWEAYNLGFKYNYENLYLKKKKENGNFLVFEYLSNLKDIQKFFKNLK